ncbi:aminotransferase, partial [Streptomyces sp. SID8499]|nr:aminotransferase [Streptomyces sp. SID8499]
MRTEHGTAPGEAAPRHPGDAQACAGAAAPGGHDLRHHGDAEVRDDGAELTDLAVNVRADTPPAWLRERIAG